MTQLNSDDFKALTDISNDLSRSVGAVSGNMTQLEKAAAAIANSNKAKDALQESINRATKNTISGLTAFASQLTNASSGDFSSLNKAIDVTTTVIGQMGSLLVSAGLGPVAGIIAGGIIKGTAKAIGEVGKFVVGQFSKAYGSFEKLSETGVVQTFENLNDTVRDTGMNYADIQRSFEKYSVTLSRFGDSTITGRKEFNRLALSSKEMSREFQLLGIGVREFSEMQLSFISQQQFSSTFQFLGAEQLKQGSKDYILQLDQLSKMTGVSRMELQKQFEEQTKNARYLAGIANLDPAVRREMDITLAQLRAISPGLADGVQDAFASGITNTESSRAAALMLGEGGLDIMQIRANLIAGGKNTEAFAAIAQAGTNYANQNVDLVKAVSDTTLFTKNSVAAMDLKTKTQKNALNSQKNANEIQKDALSGADKENVKLANTRRNMYDISTNMAVLTVSSNYAATAMAKMSSGLRKVVNYIYKFTGTKVPDYVRLSNEEAELTEKARDIEIAILKEEDLIRENNAKIKEAGNPYAAEVYETQNANSLAQLKILREREKTTKEQAALIKKEADKAQLIEFGSNAGFVGSRGSGDVATPSSRPTRTGNGVGFSYPDMSGGPPKLTRITSKEGMTASVNVKAAPQFQKLLDWFGEMGYKINSLGGYNDRNIGNTNIPSWHSSGEAIDINPAANPYGNKRITDMPEGTGAVAAGFKLGWGANWPNIKDAMHFSTGPNEGGELQARRGGIFTGPTTGYQVTLHGKEKVIPSNDNNESFSNSNYAYINDDEKAEDEDLAKEMMSFFGTIGDTIDGMIDSVNTQLKTQMLTRAFNA